MGVHSQYADKTHCYKAQRRRRRCAPCHRDLCVSMHGPPDFDSVGGFWNRLVQKYVLFCFVELDNRCLTCVYRWWVDAIA